MTTLNFRSAYVPHDISAPIPGKVGGPLSGLSVAVKDMFAIAGERVGGGSPVWLASHEPAKQHSAVVKQLLDAGATITGKTICDEFFYSITGINHHYGAPLNNKAAGRIPGGSSAGSASACSSGSCDLAIGSDTAGSVRLPAALCGVYGVRTTRGRMNMQGAMSMAPSFDAGGWFASSPGLFSKPGPILLDRWDKSQTVVNSVCIVDDAFEQADAATTDIATQFLELVSRLLPNVHHSVLAGDKIDRWREAMRITQAYEVWQTFGNFITTHSDSLGPGIKERMAIAASITRSEMEEQKPILDEVLSVLETATANQTVLVIPTVPSIAPLLSSSPEELERFRVNAMRLVCFASISGLPQVTIPIGTYLGAPVGLSLLGWRYGEEALLALAGSLSRYIGVAKN